MNIGILGAGQLARMLALAGHPLGFRFTFFDPAREVSTATLGERVQADWNDLDALSRFAEAVDVVTYEFENVPAAAVEWLSQRVAVYPASNALAASQDRLREKRLFRELGIETAAFDQVDGPDVLRDLQPQRRSILKTRTHGYDGKGQVRIAPDDDPDRAWSSVGGAPSILEEHVAFAREISIVAARAASGEIAYYPLAENVHRGGILRTSLSRPGDAAEGSAREYVRLLLEYLEYVGVIALELFELPDGRILANEFAPRVHNSGHWTIEGAETSQFENHLRAVTALPLGSAAPVHFAGMVNCIGALPDAAAVLRWPDTHLHSYGKTDRPGRKVGHVTIRHRDRTVVEERVLALDRSLDTTIVAGAS